MQYLSSCDLLHLTEWLHGAFLLSHGPRLHLSWLENNRGVKCPFSCIPSSVDGYLGCFSVPLLYVNMGVHRSFQGSVFPCSPSGMSVPGGVAGWYGGTHPDARDLSVPFAQWLRHIGPASSEQGLPFLYKLTNTCSFLSFDNNHSNIWDDISLWFEFPFPDG